MYMDGRMDGWVYWLTLTSCLYCGRDTSCRGDGGTCGGCEQRPGISTYIIPLLELICFVWQKWRFSCPSCSPQGSLCGPMSLGGEVVVR